MLVILSNLPNVSSAYFHLQKKPQLWIWAASDVVPSLLLICASYDIVTSLVLDVDVGIAPMESLRERPCARQGTGAPQ